MPSPSADRVAGAGGDPCRLPRRGSGVIIDDIAQSEAPGAREGEACAATAAQAEPGGTPTAQAEFVLFPADKAQEALAAGPTITYLARVECGRPTGGWVSGNIERILGHPSTGTLRSALWKECVHPDDAARVAAAFGRLVARGEYSHTYRIRHVDGSYRCVRDEMRVTHLDALGNGEVVGALVDITDEMRRDERLKESELLYRSLFEQSPDGVLVIDADTQLPLTFNDQAAAQLGYTREEYTRLRISDYEARETPEQTREHVERILESGGDKFLTQHRTKSGEVRDVLVTTRSVSLAGKRVFHTVYKDVTDARRTSEALQETEHQLRQAQKMEAVGRLAGGMAHDFNNTLTTILGHCDLMLQADGLCGAAEDGVTEIRRAALSAASITGRLLAFSRHRALGRRVVELSATVRGLVRLLDPALGETIALKLRLHEEELLVEVDPGDLEHALTNLTINARDALPGGGRIEVCTTACTVQSGSPEARGGVPPGLYAVLSVHDDGTGMDAETMTRIFEPFFTTKEPGTGTGLGLSMVYGMVKRSDGHIRVQSRPGAGTTFTMYLPRRHDAPATAEPLAAAPDPLSGRGTETILLVEDESAVRTLVERTLSMKGYTVVSADSAGAALDLAGRAGRPLDLVLTDVVMPEMEGPELVAELRRDHPNLRVVFMSGYAHDALSNDLGDRAAGRGKARAGGGASPFRYGYVEKPFTLDALALAVRDVLDATAAA